MANEKEFPKHRILTTGQLIRQIIESNNNGARFCFILGSGASVESGIPTGTELEKQWMDCMMGITEEPPMPKMNPEETREIARRLYEEGVIEHPFHRIEQAWNKGWIPSEFYFDLYKLRFYPNQTNGYRYLERVMENKVPSVGYLPLSLLITEKNLNNLVITTNFDSLVEDALFLFSNKRPLVVGHESLATFISSEIQRPIIAKVHRSLFYEPFNSPETTKQLNNEWRVALGHAFDTYTPIVIGYGGGDGSLMSYLEERNTKMRHGIYWCYIGETLPEKRIQSLVSKKEGYFVQIDGFDALMMEIGKQLYSESIEPASMETLLMNQVKERVEKYNEQWNNRGKKPEVQTIIEQISQMEEQKREKEGALSYWDYRRRGDVAHEQGDFETAVLNYTKAIQLRPDAAIVYNNRGYLYGELKQYEKAISDLTKAIELQPNNPEAYNNRGCVYNEMKQYDAATGDFSKAIELKSDFSIAYNNRGWMYSEMKQYDAAINDLLKAIELDPKDADYHNELGHIYYEQGNNESALVELGKAIELNDGLVKAYKTRAEVYRRIGELSLAEADEKRAERLEEKK